MQAVPMMSSPMTNLMGQNSGQMISSNGGNQQHGIPLTQPLVINTSFAGGTLNNAQTMTMTAPVQVLTCIIVHSGVVQNLGVCLFYKRSLTVDT